MSNCIECGESTPAGKFTHPDWPADDICEGCHSGKWDEWLEEKIQNYLDEVGTTGAYSDELKNWRQ